MKIQFCSDLHLEFPENKKFLEQNPIVPVGEILILAGDIVPFAVMDKHNDFFDNVASKFKMVYWIPGNHEYYHYELGISLTEKSLSKNIRENILLMNNQTITYNNLDLIFSTLWSHVDAANAFNIQRSVNDFNLIKVFDAEAKTYLPFLPAHFNQLHQTDFAFIQQAVTQNTGRKKIIVTHHVPTLMNYPAQYKNSSINEAFVVELFDFISNAGVENFQSLHWIYGHHHFNTPDFKICNTTMHTNQLGYVQNNEHKLFNPAATFEI